MNSKPKMNRKIEHTNKFRNWCAKIESSNSFETFIMICIILNTVCMAIDWYNSPTKLDEVFERINYGFAAIFTLEAVIKLFAIGFRLYFSDGWNQFDFCVVVGTIVTIII